MSASVAVDIDRLRPILRDLGAGEPASVTPLSGGSSGSFRIDLVDGGALVLKTYDDVRHKMPWKEAYAAQLLSGVDFPMTRYLAMDETRTRLPFRFAITNYLDGMTVGSLREEPDIADAYRQMGELLRKLHSVSMSGYGHFDENGVVAPAASNEDHLRDVAAHAFKQFRAYGGADGLATRLEAIVEARFDRAVESRGPVFAHDDLHPNNVLATRGPDGRLRLTGLIDFGNARAADPVFDLAKMLFCSEHEASGCTTPMLEGYGPIDHPDPKGALWFYTLLHRVIMWWWLRHVGFIADCEQHDLIRDLLAMAEDA